MNFSKTYCFYLLSLILLISCSKEEKSGTHNSDNIQGSWNLVSVSCECEPVFLNPGEQVWTFDLESNNLIVQNEVTEDLHTILESGQYPIVVTENAILLNEISYDYYFQNNSLFLADHPELDGPLIEFIP